MAAAFVGPLAAQRANRNGQADKSQIHNTAQNTAQNTRWAVYLDTLTDNPPELGRMLPLTFEVELRNRGFEVVNQLDVIAELQRTASTAFLPITTEGRMRLQRAAEEVLYALRKERMAKVLKESESALKTFEAYVPAINREAQLMMYLSTICAAQVQAHLRQRRADAADNQAARCIRLIPDADPDVSTFPPEVRDRYRGVRERLLRQKKATLAIDTVPKGRTQCAVRLNGRFIGYAPLTQVRLPDGQYDVQVECTPDRMSRVRRITITPNADLRLEVPIQFDEHLHTEDGVWFSYADAQGRETFAAEDALRVMDYLDLDHLLVVRFPFDPSKPEQMMVDRYDRPKDNSNKAVVARRVESATVNSEPPSVEEVGRVTDLLLTGIPQKALKKTAIGAVKKEMPVSADRDVATQQAAMPTAQQSSVHPTSAPSLSTEGLSAEGATVKKPDSRPGPGFWVGLGLLGGGVVTSGVAWALQADWFRLKGFVDDITPADPSWTGLNEKIDQRRTHTLIAGAAGSALVASSMFFLIQEDTPIWIPSLLGLGGAAAVTVGALHWAGHNKCADSACTRLNQRVPLGPLLVMQGGALLSAPVAYMLRQWMKPAPELKPLAHLLNHVQPIATESFSGMLYSGRF